MLEPDSRHLLVEALRPPAGYQLDRAVGTTYSLDLQALLVAPLAFAFFDFEGADEEPTRDPIALLEAVRRHAKRIHVFCQAGQIANMGKYQPIVAYVEGSVFEAVPPSREHIFHPKVWAVRYTAPNESPVLRVLCMSRNLTFDRSWDTVLVLEGTPRERGGTPTRELDRRNAPLADFFRALPGLTSGVPSAIKDEIGSLADDLRHVDFELPDRIDEIAFWPLGIDGARQWPFEEVSKLLVVSPFLTQGTVGRLGGTANKAVLVSRSESLDALGTEGVEGFGDVYVLDPNADSDEESDASHEESLTDEAVRERADSVLEGLHAKLYVAEWDKWASVFTGSANATDAAFGGNVEFLVELRGSSRTWGSRSVLERSDDPDARTFGDLLQSYAVRVGEPQEPSVREKLEKRLDRCRRLLAARRFVARVSEEGDRFTVELTTDALPADLLAGVDVSCWPVSVPAARRSVSPASPWKVRFDRVSFEGLTSFYAFQLEASEGREKVDVTMVLNAQLVGAPKDREERILASILDDRSKVLRYLLFLLGDGGTDPDSAVAAAQALTGTNGSFDASLELPLLESMVRTFVRDPARLESVAKLVEDLRSSGRDKELLPEGFDDVWGPIWEAGPNR